MGYANGLTSIRTIDLKSDINMKRFYLLFFFLLLQNLLFSQNKIDIYENDSRILELHHNGIFYYKVKSGDLIHLSISGNDVISYGQWEYCGKKIVLHTDSTLKGPYVNVNVEEKYNRKQEGIYVSILSPFEQDKKANPRSFQNAYLYALDMYTGDSIISFFSLQNDFRIDVEPVMVNKIKVSIIPYNQIYWRDSYYSRLQFEFTPTLGNNVFLLNVPLFTAFYIFYERFDEDFVRILSNKKIRFRNMTLKRRDY